jgi:hypothetical protein
MMIAFKNFLGAVGAFTKQDAPLEGARFAFREIWAGNAIVEQTHYPTNVSGGGLVPRYSFAVDGGLVSNADTSMNLIKLSLNDSVLDYLRTQWQATLAIEPQLSPESVSAEATLSDMTNATATDKENVAAIQTLKSILSMG